MRVLYDGQVYSLQAVGGVSRYFANVISRLPTDWTPSLIVDRPGEVSYPAHPNLRVYGRARPGLQRFSHRLAAYYSRIENRRLSGRAARGRFDVAHPTYYTLCTGQEMVALRCPVVITVWDMIHELFPEVMDPTGRHAEEKRRAILSAQAVICISHNTKKDLLERYPLPEGRVTVTHLASDIDGDISNGPEPVPDRPYYLYVGSRAGYKNFDGLLAAFARIAPSRPELALCVVGPPFDDAEARLISRLGLSGRVEHYGRVGDSHLAKLYRCSTAFVYPSLYEGFGIPLLEAMSCGTVVVASDSSSFPEVLGDAGLLFDPRAPDDLADILSSLADDASGRERLIERGRRRARQFSWDETASRTIGVYRSVAG
ncbi:MAG: glycosyltransferase family 4 protein [Acidobacteriota bacterium]|nr:glycosyltransferase family 4 protein [Acidobacteriota bacterium]